MDKDKAVSLFTGLGIASLSLPIISIYFMSRYHLYLGIGLPGIIGVILLSFCPLLIYIVQGSHLRLLRELEREGSPTVSRIKEGLLKGESVSPKKVKLYLRVLVGSKKFEKIEELRKSIKRSHSPLLESECLLLGLPLLINTNIEEAKEHYSHWQQIPNKRNRAWSLWIFVQMKILTQDTKDLETLAKSILFQKDAILQLVTLYLLDQMSIGGKEVEETKKRLIETLDSVKKRRYFGDIALILPVLYPFVEKALKWIEKEKSREFNS